MAASPRASGQTTGPRTSSSPLAQLLIGQCPNAAGTHSFTGASPSPVISAMRSFLLMLQCCNNMPACTPWSSPEFLKQCRPFTHLSKTLSFLLSPSQPPTEIEVTLNVQGEMDSYQCHSWTSNAYRHEIVNLTASCIALPSSGPS